jgi:predicted ATPase
MSRADKQIVPALVELRIERFKAAFQPGPVALQPFNVIIGRNGSGKSTLLEALQWLDATIRRDAREASDRYFGIGDLVNFRSKTRKFDVALTWSAGAGQLRYRVSVGDDGHGTPIIRTEELVQIGSAKHRSALISTTKAGQRRVHTEGATLPVSDSDRLALAVLGTANGVGSLAQFWSRAVFLRLSPSRLAFGSPAKRRSFEPLLDEEGQTLPALLSELSKRQRSALVDAVRELLPGIEDVSVSRAALGHDTRVNYALLEKMPYVGRKGQSRFKIPAWMLSEGTRRITAILALLVRDPPPSLLCIEEIENGLDPWTVRGILAHLRSAADRGTQVVLTTHSTWLLDHVPLDSIILVSRAGGDTRYERFATRDSIQDFAASIPPGTRYTSDPG